MKFVFLILFSQKVFAEPCNVELYSQVIKFESKQNLNQKEIIRTSSCNDSINKEIALLLSKNDGEVSVSKIEKELKDFNVHITPRKMQLFELSTILRDQLTPGSNLHFLNNKSLNNQQSISLGEAETLKAICESCNGLGEKNIKLEIHTPTENTIKTTWISSKIFAKIKVIKARRNLSFQQKTLSSEDFYTSEALTMMPDNVLGSLDNIHFFKPNKTILQDMIVTNMDIQAVNLVNYGTPVRAILRSNNVSLIKFATPVRSGQFGETVEVRIKDNKTISGKITDYNQVVIEL